MGVQVRGEVLVPHGRAILVIDDLKGSVVVGAGEAVDANLDGHAVPRHAAGEQGERKRALSDRRGHPNSPPRDLFGAAWRPGGPWSSESHGPEHRPGYRIQDDALCCCTASAFFRKSEGHLSDRCSSRASRSPFAQPGPQRRGDNRPGPSVTASAAQLGRTSRHGTARDRQDAEKPAPSTAAAGSASTLGASGRAQAGELVEEGAVVQQREALPL